VPVGTLSAADIVEIIREGKASLNIHSVSFPAGNSAAISRSQTAPRFSPRPRCLRPGRTTTPIPAPPARFLQQATFGPSPTDIRSVRSLGYAGWINHQFTLRVSGYLTNVFANADPDPKRRISGNAHVQYMVASRGDRTRPASATRAFALSETLVLSRAACWPTISLALSSYYDLLLKHSFGNFRDLIESRDLSPAMGLYLDMRRNDKGNIISGTHPNENYAREIMQFSPSG